MFLADLALAATRESSPSCPEPTADHLVPALHNRELNGWRSGSSQLQRSGC